MDTKRKALKYKSLLAVFVISETTKIVVEEMKNSQDQYKETGLSLSDENLNVIWMYYSLGFLLETQKLFWDKLNKNENDALLFEKCLYAVYKELIGVDPLQHIKRIISTINNTPQGEARFMGKLIAEELGLEPSIFTDMMLNVSYLSMLSKGGFFESIKKISDSSDEEVLELTKNVDKGIAELLEKIQ